MSAAPDDVRSLYLHIPFCERKCEYCDFTSVAGATGSEAYMDALCVEVRRLGERLGRLSLDTVFIGGGTPSLVEPELVAALLATVRSTFSVAFDAEVTMEANPSSVTAARARVWRSAGVNRVSLGVQSLEADALRFLGRVHDADRALAAVAEVREAGFTSINCDLIYAVPGLGDTRWRRTLERVVAAGPTHISCYELTVEPGTPLHTRVRRGLVRPVEGVRSMRQHRLAVDLLEGAGYGQYEVSNFALPGEECRHNLVYWHNGYYAAAGVGAHGHLPAAAAASIGLDVEAGAVSVRHWHGRGIAAYGRAIRAGDLPIAGSEPVGPGMREQERVMLGLRLREGVRIGAASLDEARSLEGLGLIAIDGDRVRATSRGEAVLNQVTLRLVGDRAA
jgi:putative oxygen-independent coproporphyrinogen III oxidase